MRTIIVDGVVKSPISCVVSDREMLNILAVCLRFRDTNDSVYIELLA
ncbi:MAG: hypothetical protein KKA70_12515 [Proteobacteria bacterium]|nr:hypothetical protein [Pseudomonadota bacterium]